MKDRVLFSAWLIRLFYGSVLVGYQVAQCFGSEPGIGPDGQFVSAVEIEKTKQQGDELPEMIMYCSKSCVPCRVGEAVLKTARRNGEFPFRLMIVESESLAPQWVEKFPTFYWGDSDVIAKSKQTWKCTGWPGLKSLKQQFELSRPGRLKLAPLETSVHNIASNDLVLIGRSHIHTAHAFRYAVHHTAASGSAELYLVPWK